MKHINVQVLSLVMILFLYGLFNLIILVLLDFERPLAEVVELLNHLIEVS